MKILDKKKAENKWVEVFLAGKHKDMKGNVKEWTIEDLDRIAAKSNSSRRDAPAVIGHPTLNARAYGWVKKNMKRVGKKLMAQFRDLEPCFIKAVNEKWYPKRSISVYADGTLRHIGWLGAMQPAVAGLADVNFGEDFSDNQEYITYEFNENLLENFIEFGGKDVDEKEKKIQELENQLSEAQKEAKEKDELIRKLQDEEKSKEFAEKEKERDELLQRLQKENETLKEEAQRKKFSDFCETELKEVLRPGSKKDAVDMMMILDGVGKYSFAEGGEQDPVEKFQSLLKDNLKAQYSLKEVATKDKVEEKPDTSTSEFAEMDNVDHENLELDAKVKAYQKKHNISSYGEAYRKVRAM